MSWPLLRLSHVVSYSSHVILCIFVQVWGMPSTRQHLVHLSVVVSTFSLMCPLTTLLWDHGFLVLLMFSCSYLDKCEAVVNTLSIQILVPSVQNTELTASPSLVFMYSLSLFVSCICSSWLHCVKNTIHQVTTMLDTLIIDINLAALRW